MPSHIVTIPHLRVVPRPNTQLRWKKPHNLTDQVDTNHNSHCTHILLTAIHRPLKTPLFVSSTVFRSPSVVVAWRLPSFASPFTALCVHLCIMLAHVASEPVSDRHRMGWLLDRTGGHIKSSSVYVIPFVLGSAHVAGKGHSRCVVRVASPIVLSFIL